MSPFARKVQRIVRTVPYGRVVSYGGVAALMGQPRAARAVGSALCALPDGSDVPWWRVINRNGEISIRCMVHGPQVQRALLEAEGVRFDRNGRVDWKRFGWSPTDGERRRMGEGRRKREGEGEASGECEAERPVRKRSVSVAVREPRGRRWLLVQRPPDDGDLPLAWGLPAASLRAGESYEEAARRAVADKLGIAIRLRGVRRTGRTERASGTLHMRLYEASIARGRPDVAAAADPGVTRYVAWRWGEIDALRPAAARGSLCCRLALEAWPRV